MAEILFEREASLPSFFKRRVTRVWPALFFFVVVAWLSVWLLMPAKSIPTEIAISCLTFTYNYVRAIQALAHPLIDHIWSLCIEEHVYLILGGVAYLKKRLRVEIAPILLLLTSAFIINGLYLTYVLNLDYYSVYWRTDVRGASILFGVLIYLATNKRPSLFSAWTPIVFFALGIALNLERVPDPVKYSLGSICLAISICSLSHLPDKLMKTICSPIINWIGLVSFSLYLWQQPFYKLIGSAPTALLLLAAVLLGTASYYLIESPARRYLNKRIG